MVHHAFLILTLATQNLATTPSRPGVLNLRATERLATCCGPAANILGHGHFHDRSGDSRPDILFRA
jgi:hypothetical protein